MEKIIDVHNVSKSFKDSEAIKEISFTIEKGETFGFLGPSGSGKTTTIKILTSQLAPSSGNITLFGQKIGYLRTSEGRKRFGILTDNSGLYARLTIEENLTLFLELYNLPKEALKEALDFVNLYGERKKKLADLSKGMIQRVNLARAILHKPELLFLDEPTSALDPVNTYHIHEGIRSLNASGTTVFLTTHDMSEADLLCNRVAFLHNGVIKEIGSPKELKKKFANNTITVELINGQTEVISKGAPDAQKVHDWMVRDEVESIYSNEPTLGDIFLKVTGRDLA
ncbi:ATP-binding cassette domain-containing protein [Pradoshia sp.]